MIHRNEPNRSPCIMTLDGMILVSDANQREWPKILTWLESCQWAAPRRAGNWVLVWFLSVAGPPGRFHTSLLHWPPAARQSVDHCRALLCHCGLVWPRTRQSESDTVLRRWPGLGRRVARGPPARGIRAPPRLRAWLRPLGWELTATAVSACICLYHCHICMYAVCICLYMHVCVCILNHLEKKIVKYEMSYRMYVACCMYFIYSDSYSVALAWLSGWRPRRPRRRQGGGCPLFYINTWAMIWPTDYPALAGAVLWKKKYIDHVNWKCVLHIPYPHHGQPGSLTDSQWCPSSVYPGRYSCSYRQIQANIMTYMQIHELIHADTTNALNRYRADTYIQYDTYRYMKFCMLYISGYTFLYVSCMCMYDGCIRRLKGSYIQHTCKIHTIYQSICPVSCMYLMFLGVCMCMYVYIWCAYDVHIFVFCVILHVFACIFCRQKC